MLSGAASIFFSWNSRKSYSIKAMFTFLLNCLNFYPWFWFGGYFRNVPLIVITIPSFTHWIVAWVTHVSLVTQINSDKYWFVLLCMLIILTQLKHCSHFS
jgi:hypothetical protein